MIILNLLFWLVACVNADILVAGLDHNMRVVSNTTSICHGNCYDTFMAVFCHDKVEYAMFTNAGEETVEHCMAINQTFTSFGIDIDQHKITNTELTTSGFDVHLTVQLRRITCILEMSYAVIKPIDP